MSLDFINSPLRRQTQYLIALEFNIVLYVLYY